MLPFTLRAPCPDEYPAVTALLNAHYIAVSGKALMDEIEVKETWELDGFDLEQDALLAVLPDGTLAGYMDVLSRPPYVRINMLGATHPDYLRQGIGTALIQFAEQRAQRQVSRAPADANVILRAHVLHQHDAAHALLKKFDYRVTRFLREMIIDLDQPIPEPVFPAGFRVRAMEPERDVRAVFDAYQDSFGDHYGFVQDYSDAAFAHFQQQRLASEEFDPALWLIAEHEQTGEIAGLSLSRGSTPEDPNMAWVDTLGVRRNYRRRGLALSLLRYTFGVHQQMGKTSVALGVDADSLTGAHKLYEQAGMRLYQQFDTLEKLIRDGVDYATQKLEA